MSEMTDIVNRQRAIGQTQFNMASLPQPQTMATVTRGLPNAMTAPPKIAANPMASPTTPVTPTPQPAPTTPPPTWTNGQSLDQFNTAYGGDSAPLRNALGFSQGSQQNVDLLAPFRVTASDGSSSIDASNPQLQKMIDDGYISYGSNGLGGEQAGMEYRTTDKMPKTVYGNAGVSAYDPSLHLFNDQSKTWDPNYGWVTPTQNVDTRGSAWEEAIYNYAPALAMMAMTGGAGIGALGSTLLRAPGIIGQLANGNTPYGSLANIGLTIARGAGGGGP
jgi:hypothetical protein